MPSIRKDRPGGLIGLRIGFDELTVQNVLAPSHQPQDRPIGYRQQIDAENTEVSNIVLVQSGQYPGKVAVLVKTAESDCLSVRCFGTIVLNGAAGVGPARNVSLWEG